MNRLERRDVGGWWACGRLGVRVCCDGGFDVFKNTDAFTSLGGAGDTRLRVGGGSSVRHGLQALTGMRHRTEGRVGGWVYVGQMPLLGFWRLLREVRGVRSGTRWPAVQADSGRACRGLRRADAMLQQRRYYRTKRKSDEATAATMTPVTTTAPRNSTGREGRGRSALVDSDNSAGRRRGTVGGRGR